MRTAPYHTRKDIYKNNKSVRLCKIHLFNYLNRFFLINCYGACGDREFQRCDGVTGSDIAVTMVSRSRQLGTTIND